MKMQIGYRTVSTAQVHFCFLEKWLPELQLRSAQDGWRGWHSHKGAKGKHGKPGTESAGRLRMRDSFKDSAFHSTNQWEATQQPACHRGGMEWHGEVQLPLKVTLRSRGRAQTSWICLKSWRFGLNLQNIFWWHQFSNPQLLLDFPSVYLLKLSTMLYFSLSSEGPSNLN
jgi:hypothetical protein